MQSHLPRLSARDKARAWDGDPGLDHCTASSGETRAGRAPAWPVKTRRVNPLKPTAPHLPPHPSVSLSLSVSCLGGGGSSTVCLCQSPDLSPERVHCTVRKLYLNHVQLEKTNWIKIRIIS